MNDKQRAKAMVLVEETWQNESELCVACPQHDIAQEPTDDGGEVWIETCLVIEGQEHVSKCPAVRRAMEDEG